MKAMIQAAVDRQAHLDKLIAQREAEIAEYQAEAEKLETLIGLANELFTDDAEPGHRTAKPMQAPQHTAPQSVQHPKPQAIAPTLQPAQAHPAPAPEGRVMPARQPRTA